MAGRVVRKLGAIRAASGEHVIALDTRGLASGVYLVRVRSGSHAEALHRLVVTR